MFAKHLLWAALLHKLFGKHWLHGLLNGQGYDHCPHLKEVVRAEGSAWALTAVLLRYSEYLHYPSEELVTQIHGMAFCVNFSQPILLATSKNLNTKNKDLTFSCMLSHQEGENLYLTLWEGFALLKELKDKDKLLKSYMEQREHSGLESKYLNLSYSIKGTKKMVSHIFSLLLSCACAHTHYHSRGLTPQIPTPWIWKETEG